MNVNHRYVLEFARRLATEARNPRLKILDFGCGGGAVVQAGLAQGLDISGADSFQERASDRSTASQSGFLGSRILEIREGRLPWPPEYFDLVISNQVFEHVAELGAVVREIHRVLKPDGTLLALLPHSGVIWEVHSRLPMVHWFPRRSRMRFWWSLAMCRCLSRNRNGMSARSWTKHSLAWIDEFCFYKTRREIDRLLASGFEVQHIEEEYAGFRRNQSQLWRIAMPFSGALAPLNGPIFRVLGGLVVLARKSESVPRHTRSTPAMVCSRTAAGSAHCPEIGDLPADS